MANYCDTMYTVEGDLKQLTSLYNALTLCWNNTANFREVLGYLGIDSENIYCRCGLISDPTMDKTFDGRDYIEFDTNSAWADPYEAIGAIMEKLPGLKFWCQAEEPGCCYFVVKGPDRTHYDVKWLLKGCDFWEYYGPDEKERLTKDVAKLTKTEVSCFDDIKGAIERYNAENNLPIEFEEFDVGELCNEV